jgi:DNA repair protein RecN (Recombination protein N)
MLVALSIRDIVLIDKLDIVIEPGLTVLTGETGAGKSILLDSLALALGARGDAGLVRQGAAQGQVTAEFDVSAEHPVRAMLGDAGISTDTDPIILRRLQAADGRTRAYVNDQPVSAQVLRAVGSALVEIHGQHDDRALVDPASHRALLDAFGGLADQADDVGALHRAWRTIAAAREEAAAKLTLVRREADYLRHAHEELSRLAPEPGEEDSLAIRRQTMMVAEKVAGDVKDAFDTLDGTSSPIPTLAALARRLERKQATLPQHLDPVITALGSALDAVEDARAGLDRALRVLDFDPKELERVEERLFALRAASRKFAVAIADLPALANRFAADLAALDQGEERVRALEAETAQAEERYRRAADALSKARRAAALKLDKAVMAELAPLKLDGARFATRIDSSPVDAGPTGIDSVSFWVQTNPGTAAGPLMKVASGGELARFVLALKVVLANRGSAPTLVFDEIDTGVGGAVAEAIGLRLARLAATVQVLAITHAPQVAARSRGHFLIEKQPVDTKRVATRMKPLDDLARREEIARMLSGARITDEARAQADRLIGGAQ